MSTMVERVARALCPERDGPNAITGDDGRFYPAGQPRWLQWELDARRAIAAMRDAPIDGLHISRVKIFDSVFTVSDWIEPAAKEDCPHLRIEWPSWAYDRESFVHEMVCETVIGIALNAVIDEALR